MEGEGQVRELREKERNKGKGGNQMFKGMKRKNMLKVTKRKGMGRTGREGKSRNEM